MNLKIKTTTLQEMVSRAVRGVGNNKLLPITSLMGVSVKDNELSIVTTDATNYLYVKETLVNEDFSIVVPADVFAKLVARMTCEMISLTVDEENSSLTVSGNGKYVIELPVDESGALIKFPNPVESIDYGDSIAEINRTTVNIILNSIKPALALTQENPCYTGYFVGDRVIATDTSKIACLDVPVIGVSVLISPEMMNLLSVMTDEKIAVYMKDANIMFKTADCTVHGVIMAGIEDYSIDAINELIDMKFASMCKLPKQLLLQVLDRISLFIGSYDENRIKLVFTKSGLEISSVTSNSVEVIDYVESENFTDFVCYINADMLKSLVRSQLTDAISLYYGNDNAVKLIDGNLIDVLALEEKPDTI